ncbi:hypothetical protein BRC77_04945 [Halobacteriales archaeon QH_8_64_26]|nr:MAG: hypothetical protein BRC77_04945 [Halobacteriales archaeon QH_8_64_26]
MVFLVADQVPLAGDRSVLDVADRDRELGIVAVALARSCEDGLSIADGSVRRDRFELPGQGLAKGCQVVGLAAKPRFDDLV